MMNNYQYGSTSLKRLYTCHPDLITFAKTGIITSPVDMSIVCGFRGELEQNKAFDEGFSRARFGESPHNVEDADGEPLSLGIDIIPYVDGKGIWDANHAAFKELSDHLKAVAKELYENNAIEQRIEWGGDWTSFVDKPHWQARGWKTLRDKIMERDDGI